MPELVKTTIAVFLPDRITVSGPPVSPSPKTALSPAPAVNERVRNALKFAALSVPTGALKISWTTSAQDPGTDTALVRSRGETGGSPVIRLTRREFGTVPVENVLASDSAGGVQIDYHPGGVRCVLTAPVA